MRALLGGMSFLWLVAGCTVSDGLRTCTWDADCGDGGKCDTSVNLCYAAGTEPELDGGSCTPACGDYQACTKGGCVARFNKLTFQVPTNGDQLDGGSAQVQAFLEVKDTYRSTTRFPDALVFSAAPSGGGNPGTFGNFTHDDAGTYRAVWTPPAVESQVTLSVAHPDPDAGLMDSVTVDVDSISPAFTVNVPPANPGVSDGGIVYEDPDAGGLTHLWRRDQTVPVEIRTNEPNLDPSSVKVGIRGTDNVPRPLVAVTPFTTGCDAAFCGVAQLNLWEPPFNAFRAPLQLDVEGHDRVGNPGIVSPASPQVNVTRWKWGFHVPAGTIKASPALGAQGSIYFGTTVNNEGKVYALSPDGMENWEATVGAVTSVAVGASDGGMEFVYAATNPASNKAALYALSGGDGGTSARCPDATNTYAGQIQSSMAVMNTTVLGVQYESGVAVVNNGGNTQLNAIRPLATGGNQCAASNTSAGIPQANTDGALITNNATYFYPTDSFTIVSYDFGSSSPNWTASTGNQPIYGLAMGGGNIIGGGGALFNQGGLYSVPTSGSTSATVLSGTENARVWSPVIGTGSAQAFFGQDTSNSQGALKRYDLAGTAVTQTVPNVGIMRYAPALGADGVLYTAASTSEGVAARSATNLSSFWAESLGGAPSSAAVALDCSRNASGTPLQGKPGVLYVPSGGVLHAIVVDSPGLRADAAWPKFQHDQRNTGNPATPITACP